MPLLTLICANNKTGNENAPEANLRLFSNWAGRGAQNKNDEPERLSSLQRFEAVHSLRSSTSITYLDVQISCLSTVQSPVCHILCKIQVKTCPWVSRVSHSRCLEITANLIMKQPQYWYLDLCSRAVYISLNSQCLLYLCWSNSNAFPYWQ